MLATEQQHLAAELAAITTGFNAALGALESIQDTALIEAGEVSEPLAEYFRDTTSALEAIAGEVQELTDSVAHLPEGIQGRVESARQRAETFFQDWAAGGEEMADEIFARAEQLPALIEGKWENIEENVKDLQELLTETVAGQMQEKVQAAATGWKESLEGMVKKHVDELEEAAGEFQAVFEEELKKLAGYAKDEVTSTLKGEYEKTLDTALDYLRDEIVSSVQLATMQAQLTALISPILPPLLVVRGVAGPIKQGLQILRMGF